ncbi:toll/interleukin-1 receptor domain-containing protein [Actinomadura oligospora]|uniref:toll/interleukin-1 receptor domain-containing protein n=1 Tax=Actinomadura oligospora TaxID=111804 RepID=UPI0004B7F32E|nr:toll/interleukin-1 receptor domain-containing protein [Actinomadura oligospora]
MRHLLVAVDAKGYGSANDHVQGLIQNGLLRVLEDAAERAGLARRTWFRQPGGDGELAVLPAGESEPKTVENLPRELAAALREHNRDVAASARLRLRLALHHGVAVPAANGHLGAGVVAVARLCDSTVLKAMLAASDADLAVAYSERIFEDAIRQGHTRLPAEELREVRVVNKEFDQPAWVWVPGHDAHALSLPDTVRPAEETAAPFPDLATAPEGRVDAVICFAEQDVTLAERLALRLRDRGLAVYIDPWAEIGSVILHERERAIAAAPNGVLLFSRAALANAKVMDDYAALLSRVHAPGGGRFVPVLVEDVSLPELAAIRQPLDLTGAHAEDESRIDLLARALRAEPSV